MCLIGVYKFKGCQVLCAIASGIKLQNIAPDNFDVNVDSAIMQSRNGSDC